jgi:hypothetical protein
MFTELLYMLCFSSYYRLKKVAADSRVAACTDATSGAANFLLKKCEADGHTPTPHVWFSGNKTEYVMPLTADLLCRCFMRSLMPWFERA